MSTVKTDVSKLKKGDYLSRTSYLLVKGSDPLYITVQNEQGLTWTIEKGIVASECFSANQYDETITVTRTELAEIFSKTGDKVYTVSFNKQPKIDDVFDKIANKGKIISNKEMKKALVAGMKGQERILIGYTINVETGFGRSLVVDLEAEQDPNKPYSTVQRQVDHRSLNWLIVGNKKCVCKDYKEPKA